MLFLCLCGSGTSAKGRPVKRHLCGQDGKLNEVMYNRFKLKVLNKRLVKLQNYQAARTVDPDRARRDARTAARKAAAECTICRLWTLPSTMLVPECGPKPFLHCASRDLKQVRPTVTCCSGNLPVCAPGLSLCANAWRSGVQWRRERRAQANVYHALKKIGALPAPADGRRVVLLVGNAYQGRRAMAGDAFTPVYKCFRTAVARVVPVVLVDEFNTSQYCVTCESKLVKRARNNPTGLEKDCPECGQVDRDTNGGGNIDKRGEDHLYGRGVAEQFKRSRRSDVR